MPEIHTKFIEFAKKFTRAFKIKPESGGGGGGEGRSKIRVWLKNFKNENIKCGRASCFTVNWTSVTAWMRSALAATSPAPSRIKIII